MNRLLLLSLALMIFGGCVPEDADGEGPARPEPVITAPAEMAVPEGSGGTVEVEIPLSLQGLALTNVTLKYRTESGTAEGGADYVSVNEGRVLFTPSSREKTITLTILADAVREEDEFLDIVLYDPKNATLERERITLTLTNDDAGVDPYNIPTEGYTTPETYDGMQLVWADEFVGESIDETSWTFEIGRGNNGWGNNELQYYQRENAFLHNGHLLIEAREEQQGGAAYTSARMISLDKREFKYGRIDIRAALPEGQGLWPALWMMGHNLPQIGWPAAGEIDIMEVIGSIPNRVHGTAHYGASSSQHQFRGGSKTLPANESFADEFHVFSLVWEEDRILWLLDDMVYFELTSDDIGAASWPFNKAFFFIMNVAVGGNWPGSPDQTTIFPQRMIVDYIRVFQPG